MFLIGQYDSPFVRRVAIAMRLYGIKFDHKPWSTFGDAEKIAPYNPLRRVPTLVLDSGEALIESHIILDYLDELVGEEKAMIAPHGAERRRHLRICALATGLGDKSVSLVYESVLRKEQLKLWVERCEAQIAVPVNGVPGKIEVGIEDEHCTINHEGHEETRSQAQKSILQSPCADCNPHSFFFFVLFRVLRG